MRALVVVTVFSLAVYFVVQAPVALAQRNIIGAGEAAVDAGPPPLPVDPQAKKNAAPPALPDDKQSKPAAAKRDVLTDTAAEKLKKSKEDEAKEAAEKAAEAAAEAAKQKKAAEQQKLADDKKAAEAKKKLENKDQRLAAAKKIRQLTRTSGPFSISVAIEPGQVHKDALLEVRLDVAQKLDVPDPRYGNLLPIKDARLTATVSGTKGRVRAALHPLETPGRYGFHSTPARDGQMSVQVTGTTGDGKTFDVTFPIHVGVWPPPDFEDEEKNNLATTDASRGGRKVVGGTK